MLASWRLGDFEPAYPRVIFHIAFGQAVFRSPSHKVVVVCPRTLGKIRLGSSSHGRRGCLYYPATWGIRMGVGDWFSTFCISLRMDSAKRSSLAYRTGRITKAVNLSFRNLDSDSAYRFYVGSLGRNTAIPSVSDADLLIELPATVYHQYNAYSGNKQSALLTAVRAAIRTTYKTSDAGSCSSAQDRRW